MSSYGYSYIVFIHVSIDSVIFIVNDFKARIGDNVASFVVMNKETYNNLCAEFIRISFGGLEPESIEMIPIKIDNSMLFGEIAFDCHDYYSKQLNNVTEHIKREGW